MAELDPGCDDETENGVVIERAYGDNTTVYRVRYRTGGVSIAMDRNDIRELAEAAGFDVED